MKRVFIDMDNVLVDFQSGQFPDWESVLRYLLSEKKEQ